MPDLQVLLDQIDQLDQEATKGPWEYDGSTIDSKTTFDEVVTTEVNCSMYCYGGTGKGVQDDNDAEFIALARTFTPAAAKALRAVLELHKTRVHDEDPTSPFCNFCGPGTPCETTRAITDAMEDSADRQALDQARAEDDGTRITLDKYLEDDDD